MKPRRSADSGKFLEWLPKPSQTTSCSHDAFGRNPEDSLPLGAARSKLLARNNFQLATQPGAIVITPISRLIATDPSEHHDTDRSIDIVGRRLPLCQNA